MGDFWYRPDDENGLTAGEEDRDHMEDYSLHPPSLTKIIATLGPASEQLVEQMARRGVRVFRLNLSHGEWEWRERMVEQVRRAEHSLHTPLSVLCDLKGKKIRVALDRKLLNVKEGERIHLLPDEQETNQPHQSQSHSIQSDTDDTDTATIWLSADIFDALSDGNILVMGDGELRMKVEEVAPGSMYGRMLDTGIIRRHMGITLPGIRLGTGGVTDSDLEDIERAIEIGVDMIGLSFVGDVDDVRRARKIAGDLPVIAKVERWEALDNILDIVKASDGLMVARGDLGLEVSLENVPLIQKNLLLITRRYRKVGIVATQMLESMLHSPNPTRAEVGDVAGAIFDGADAVMLSGETAVGNYPLEAVSYLTKVALQVEKSPLFKDVCNTPIDFEEGDDGTLFAISEATVQLSRHLGASTIVTPTATGNTSQSLSAFRPNIPIFALSPSLLTRRRLVIVWGVVPIDVRLKGCTLSSLTDEITDMLKNAGYSLPFILTGGHPLGVEGTTRVIKVVSD
ncbi:MAG: pyruvate kinase [Methermicoccaceae archaeon]